MYCDLIASTYAHRFVGARLEISYIKCSAALVASSLLGINGILFFSGGKSTVYAIRSALVLLNYTVWHM